MNKIVKVGLGLASLAAAATAGLAWLGSKTLEVREDMLEGSLLPLTALACVRAKIQGKDEDLIPLLTGLTERDVLQLLNSVSDLAGTILEAFTDLSEDPLDTLNQFVKQIVEEFQND